VSGNGEGLRRRSTAELLALLQSADGEAVRAAAEVPR